MHYATSNGSATAGDDYATTSGTVTFGPGETEKIVSVTILDDNLIENPENFFVTLSDPTGATLDPAGGAVATVTIADNESGTGTIQLGASAYSVSEGGQSVSVAVVRSGGLGFQASVNLSTADDTAVAGSDYTPVSVTVTFGPGEYFKQYEIPITDDAMREADEDFSVKLSMPSARAALGTPSSASAIILDNDPPLPPPPPDNSTKLMNVSTRGAVQSGEDVMIAGLIVQGTGNKRVVPRGIGPSLTQSGVANAINDPTLTLSNKNGVQLHSMMIIRPTPPVIATRFRRRG